MTGSLSFVPLLSVLLFLPSIAVALPLCLNNEAPASLTAPLKFCSSFARNDSCCCNSTTDLQLQAAFQSLNISNAACAGYLNQLLCSQCDPYAGELFQVNLQQKRTVPVLCNATLASNATLPSNTSTRGYCEEVWETCKDVTIAHSPFAPALQGAGGSSTSQSASKLTDLWQSENDFCNALGGTPDPGKFCYSGTNFLPFKSTEPQAELEGICFEKIANGVYLNMIPHPDGTNRVFVTSQDGKIWLATVPMEGSGQPLLLNEAAPFLDISDRVVASGEYGLLGLAFHPNFINNGRFFVSYNCDKTVWSDCSGRCACNTDTGCTPSDLGPEADTIPCKISSVISEYTANTSSSISASEASTADPNEVRRTFTMGLPYKTHHAGQILFGPSDNYLYFMMGDGGSSGDPFNFAQNKKSLLGKIMRFDIDTIPSADEKLSLSLWGNYSIPADNPFQDNASQPEIWAYGLRNPWRCSFDKIDPSYFYCADVGQEVYEEVDLITRGGNYGWRVYEGTGLYTPPNSPGGSTSANSIQPIFPILEYSHVSINPTENAASITGGFVSRSSQDACLYGRYVYADLYGTVMWAAAETPLGSGNYSTSRVDFVCSGNSTLECQVSKKTREPSFLYVFSYGMDNTNNLYVLSSSGVYKVVNPKGCGFTCNATLPAGAVIPVVAAPPSSAPLAVSPASVPAPTSMPPSAGLLLSPKFALHFLAVGFAVGKLLLSNSL